MVSNHLAFPTSRTKGVKGVALVWLMELWPVVIFADSLGPLEGTAGLPKMIFWSALRVGLLKRTCHSKVYRLSVRYVFTVFSALKLLFYKGFRETRCSENRRDDPMVQSTADSSDFLKEWGLSYYMQCPSMWSLGALQTPELVPIHFVSELIQNASLYMGLYAAV